MKTEETETKWIPPGKACKILNVSPSKLRRMGDQGELTQMRVSGGWRWYSEEEIVAIADRSVTPVTKVS